MVTVTNAPRTTRVPRRPEHRFLLKTKPWQIQPFMIAPVLPGETMKNLLLQARVVSDPIKHPLIGWWAEYYFFYVRLRSLAYDQQGKVLDDALLADIEKLVIDPAFVWNETHAADAALYTYQNAPSWSALCLKRVTEEYFRDADEDWDGYTIGGLPAAKIMQDNLFNSLMNAAEYAPIDTTMETSDNSGAGDPHHHTISMQDLNKALQEYQWARMNNLTDMSFEDYVRTHGVSIRGPVSQTPELLRYIREWTYPTNTVDPASGQPTSALSWSIRASADKDRFFREPGFIFGVAVQRPKVYVAKQSGSGVGLLDRATAWLPALLADDPFVGWRSVAKAAHGPIAANTITDADGYWLDVKDLYIHGDQFVNYALAGGNNEVQLPAASSEHKYPADTDVENFFRFVGDDEEPTLTDIRQDGVVSLNIASKQEDFTARTSVL